LETDFVTGGTFNDAILDVNNDGTINKSDSVNSQVVSGVMTNSLGISKTPVWLDPVIDSSGQQTDTIAYKIMTGTSGGFATERNVTPTHITTPSTSTVTRRSWIQIR
jgi:hypothetical protein